jgi:hypothetical protein
MAGHVSTRFCSISFPSFQANAKRPNCVLAYTRETCPKVTIGQHIAGLLVLDKPASILKNARES